jgi:hypothetical protein
MLMAVAATAQLGVGLNMTLSPSERRNVRPPENEPVFSGPTVKGDTGEFGFSAGIASSGPAIR